MVLPSTVQAVAKRISRYATTQALSRDTIRNVLSAVSLLLVCNVISDWYGRVNERARCIDRRIDCTSCVNDGYWIRDDMLRTCFVVCSASLAPVRQLSQNLIDQRQYQSIQTHTDQLQSTISLWSTSMGLNEWMTEWLFWCWSLSLPPSLSVDWNVKFLTVHVRVLQYRYIANNRGTHGDFGYVFFNGSNFYLKGYQSYSQRGNIYSVVLISIDCGRCCDWHGID